MPSMAQPAAMAEERLVAPPWVTTRQGVLGVELQPGRATYPASHVGSTAQQKREWIPGTAKRRAKMVDEEPW